MKLFEKQNYSENFVSSSNTMWIVLEENVFLVGIFVFELFLDIIKPLFFDFDLDLDLDFDLDFVTWNNLYYSYVFYIK